MAEKIGDAASFYKIGLGMLTTGGLSAAMELKEQGRKVFLDMKLFDIGNTVEAAVRGLSAFELDLLTVHGDPHVVQAAIKGRENTGTKIMAVTILTSLDRSDPLIRDLPEAKDRLIVTPGVRPTHAEAGDQKRIATPAQAISDGADHIVVGRPISRASDPREAALNIVADMNRASGVNSTFK